MVEITWTTTAAETLEKLCVYIARDSPYYAQKVAKDILKATEKLAFFPKQGKKVPELNRPDMREILLYSYRLIYKVESNRIYILRLLHVRQKRSDVLN
jgi:plasmid stabilization system protein ParE